jgi:hypothetical protein
MLRREASGSVRFLTVGPVPHSDGVASPANVGRDRRELSPATDPRHTYRETEDHTMPRIEVLTEVRGRDAKTVLSEHVPAELLADQHFADQLVERLGWALADAEHEERAVRR